MFVRHEGHGSRCPALDQAVQGVPGGRGGLVQVPEPGEEGPVGVREVGQRGGGGVQGAAQHPLDVVHQAPHGRLVEERRVVLDHEAQSVRVVGQIDAEVEGGALAGHVEQGGGEPGRVEVDAAFVLVLDHDLEEWIAARVAVRVERADQFVEGDAPVLVRRRAAVAHPAQQRREVRFAAEVDTERDGVEEEPDLVLGARRPGGDRGAEHHLALSGVPAEDRADGTGQRHEEGGPVPGGERPQSVDESGVQGVGQARARAGPDGGAGAVRGQGELGGVGQFAAPEVQGGGEFGRIRALGGGRLGQRRGLLTAVVGGEVAGEDGGGGGVEDDVVGQQEEQMPLRREPQQPGGDERAFGEIHAVGMGGENGPQRLLLARPAVVVDRAVQPDVGAYLLVGHAVRLPEHRAQRGVPVGHPVQRLAQGGQVERPVEADRLRLAIHGGARVQPFEEPDAALGGRQGRTATTRRGRRLRGVRVPPDPVQHRQPGQHLLPRHPEVHEAGDLIGTGRHQPAHRLSRCV